jgi:hypothetical protein
MMFNIIVENNEDDFCRFLINTEHPQRPQTYTKTNTKTTRVKPGVPEVRLSCCFITRMLSFKR